MADDLDNDDLDSDDLGIDENQSPVAGRSKKDHDSPNSLRRLSLSKFRPAWDLPKIRLPEFRTDRFKGFAQKENFVWLWLVIILISYIFLGYFLSIILTIPVRKNLAIAGFAIAGLLPTITAFADYELMKWSYLLSGFLIVGGLIFLAKVQFYFVFLAIMLWLSTTMIALAGESLLKQNRRFFVAIAILTIPCVLGLTAGWQIWRLVAANLS